jgi:hypothetical protein
MLTALKMSLIDHKRQSFSVVGNDNISGNKITLTNLDVSIGT